MKECKNLRKSKLNGLDHKHVCTHGAGALACLHVKNEMKVCKPDGGECHECINAIGCINVCVSSLRLIGVVISWLKCELRTCVYSILHLLDLNANCFSRLDHNLAVKIDCDCCVSRVGDILGNTFNERATGSSKIWRSREASRIFVHID